MNPKQIGIYGEELACIYLNRIGFSIYSRNFRTKFGEIDIVAVDVSGILVIIEVKTLRSIYGSIFLPEDNFTTQKHRHVNRMAEYFIAKHPDLIFDIGWRIDLIAIEIMEDKKIKLRHYKNI